MIINESEMNFGDYAPERVFQIENSELHLSFPSGTRTVEFVLLRKNNCLLFVEAKTSCPNAANRNETEDKQADFEKFYCKVTDKFIDSLQMVLASTVRKNLDTTGMGRKIKEIGDYSGIKIKFVLVIKTAENAEWLKGPQVELETRLKRWKKLWKAEVVVLNEKMAEELGLLVPGSD